MTILSPRCRELLNQKLQTERAVSATCVTKGEIMYRSTILAIADFVERLLFFATLKGEYSHEYSPFSRRAGYGCLKNSK
jgi:hypothetical protein